MVNAGSSPLARGLPTAAAPPSPAARIIPARAGFTRGIICIPGEPGDHPRSRGVYGYTVREDGDHWGSSPLARGLRETNNVKVKAAGIIPARAGFTRRSPSLRPVSRDHPRSRGVY